MAKFKIGDNVKLLKTRGIKQCMLVAEIIIKKDKPIEYKCIWHNENNEHQEAIYPEELLTECFSNSPKSKIIRGNGDISLIDEEGFRR